jgi:radical SAM protein with 4Fe4S-binding SPASM domain
VKWVGRFQIPKTLKDWLLPRAVAVDAPPMIQPGLYHFQREQNGEHIRYHLRVDEDGPAILLAAAAEALLLSPAGAAAAKGMLEGKSAAELESSLPTENPRQVVEDVRHALADLGQWDVRYPIFNLVDPALFERPWKISAPFQADVVVGAEGTGKAILDRLWKARIPHVRFIATPRTGKDTIAKVVMHAEDLGMIAGVRIRKAQWLDSKTLESLALAGVDYVVLPWGVTRALHDRWYGQRDFEALWDVIPEILRNEVTPVVDAALLRSTWEQFPARLDELIAAGVNHMELYAIVEDALVRPNDAEVEGFDGLELRQLAGWIEDLADRRKVQLIWLPPVFRSKNRSHDELIRQSPRAGGDVSVRVDADGNVIPPRGPRQIAGNVLEQDWESIWQHEVFRNYRLRLDSPTRCAQCPDMTVCAAACPADQESWVLP